MRGRSLLLFCTENLPQTLNGMVGFDYVFTEFKSSILFVNPLDFQSSGPDLTPPIQGFDFFTKLNFTI